ncbi:MAG: recombinase family protein [Candidatus Pacebacteria bacterium]|nr:recombinase family protein [Candidatus Paceibacterota bacterium]
MKNIIFCRVSSKEQEETGYSLDAQEELLKDYSEKKQFNTVKIFKISESASGKQVRKLFNETFAYATKNKINIICCEKIDRLTRNLKDASLAQDWIDENKDRQIHFVKESFILSVNTRAHENLVWDMKVAIARFYANNLSEEVKKGQKEKLSQGWLPLKPPLGYKTIGEKGHKTHIIDEETAPFIKKMFELYSTGNYSTAALVDIMHKEGLRTRNSKKLVKSRLNDLLNDPFYYGKIRWNGEIMQGKQEPIISIDLFNAVQAKLNRKLKSPLYTKHSPVFKAKMECAECGGMITWEIQKGHWYGHCNHYKNCSQKVWIRQEKVEDILIPMFEKMAPKGKKVLEVLEKALKETHADEIKYYTNSVNSINKIIAIAQHRIEAIYEDKIDGKITPEFYSRKLEEYSKQKEEANDKLKKLNDGNTKYYQAGFALHELALRAGDIYKSPRATTEDKRLLLSKIFSNLTLNADTITPNYTSAFQFLTKWIPILNNTFEPAVFGSTKAKEGIFMPSCPEMLRR